MHSKEELISFGEYMVSNERTKNVIDHPDAKHMAPVEDRLKQVHDTDYHNWLELTKK